MMQAAYIDQTGGINEIKIGELPIPEIKANEVLVKVIAATVNFVDTFVRAGTFKTELEFPFVIGRDAVGEVVACDDKVTGFKKGELVWTNSMGYDGRMGTTSQYTAVPQTRLFKVPSGVEPLKLVASVHSAATAAILLADILQVQTGKSILIEGAAGHVGTKLVSVAQYLGLSVSTTSNVLDFDDLRNLGVRNCYDYQKPISDINQKFDYIVDTSGKVDLQINLDQLELYGQIGLLTAPQSNRFQFDVRKMYTQSQVIKGFVISHASLEQLQKAGQILNDNFAQGKLLDDVILKMPLEKTAEGQEMLVKHQTKKQKIVLIMPK